MKSFIWGLCCISTVLGIGPTLPETYVGLIPNNWYGGPLTFVTSVPANVDPKTITYTSTLPIFRSGPLPAGQPTTTQAVLTTGSCTLWRSSDPSESSSTLLTLYLPANTAGCEFVANVAGTANDFILPAAWFLPNPVGSTTVTATATGQLNNAPVAPVTAIAFPAQVIVPLSAAASNSLGPRYDQLAFGVVPNNFYGAPFMTTVALSATAGKLQYTATRAIFAQTLPQGAPSTVSVYLYQGAPACTLTRNVAGTTHSSLELDIPLTCSLKQGGVVQPFTFPQQWLLPNPAQALVLISVHATNNGLGGNVILPSNFALYRTSGYNQITCSNVNEYFTPGPWNQISALSDAQRANIAYALSNTTICDTADWRLSMAALPTWPFNMSMPGAAVTISAQNYGPVPPVARGVFTTYPPVSNSFYVLGVPAPSQSNVLTPTVVVIPTESGAVVGLSSVAASAIGGAMSNFASITGVPVVPGARAAKEVTQPISLERRKLLFLLNANRFQMDGVPADVYPMDFHLISPEHIGVVLAYVNTTSNASDPNAHYHGWVSITELGAAWIAKDGHYILRVPTGTVLAGYSALPIEKVGDDSDDALFAILVLLIIPVVCCLAALAFLAKWLMGRRPKTCMQPAYQMPVMAPQELMMTSSMYPAPYFSGPYSYSLPMPMAPTVFMG